VSAIANLSVSRQDSSIHQRHVALALGRGHLDECSRHGGKVCPRGGDGNAHVGRTGEGDDAGCV